MFDFVSAQEAVLWKRSVTLSGCCFRGMFRLRGLAKWSRGLMAERSLLTRSVGRTSWNLRRSERLKTVGKKKIVASIAGLQESLVVAFIRLRTKQGVPTELTLDLDATDDPVHGEQLGKFFHGYCKSYCYLPLNNFCRDWPLGAVLRLRTSMAVPARCRSCRGSCRSC